MSLFSPTSQAEYDAVLRMLQTLKASNSLLFNRYIAIDGVYVGNTLSNWLTNWFSYGSNTRLPITMNWDAGQPDNFGIERCLAISNNILLNNVECGYQTNVPFRIGYRFLCKRTATSG
jgi:hypothetical protein